MSHFLGNDWIWRNFEKEIIINIKLIYLMQQYYNISLHFSDLRQQTINSHYVTSRTILPAITTYEEVLKVSLRLLGDTESNW